jgi:transposase
MNKVVDEVRKEDAKKNIELKMTKYVWLKNEARLSQAQYSRLSILENSYPTLGAVYWLKEQFKELLNDAYHTTNLNGINQWMKMAWKSVIVALQRFVNSLAEHCYGFITSFKHCVTNG